MAECMINIATPEPEHEHPIVAWIAIAAIVAAVVLISWARVEVHGTEDLEAALYEETETKPSPQGDAAGQEAQIDDAVTASRWASAFSP
jgi:hypothetical protein